MVFPIEKLGRCIKDFRELTEMDVPEFARRSGLSASHVRKLERGARRPTIKSLFKMIEVLGMSPATFFLHYTETEEEDLRHIANVYPDELTRMFKTEFGWSVIERTK